MKRIIQNHRELWQKKEFTLATFVGLIFLAVSFVVNYLANIYAAERVSNSVTDLLLSVLPVVDTEIIFIEGAFVFVAFIVLLLAHEPRRIPFVLKSAALFIVVRSIFITFTHLGPTPETVITDSNEVTRTFSLGADLFFSGHTGLPFLFALMFWNKYYLRIIFLLSSVIAAASVLLAHLHYSIDVFAAFFITYGIFHIAQWLFEKDYKIFIHGIHKDIVDR
jgi:membrane-associated phospholipid phosphatase